MDTYTIDDALTVMGFGKFQALVLAYAGMGWVAEAMEVMLLSFLGSLMRKEWKVSAQDESLLSSVVFAGMLIGACAWGYVSDKYGRRTVLLFTTFLTSGMGFLSALSPNYLYLLALRFFVGIGVGGCHVFASWFLEFVPARNRGAWMVIFFLFWTAGTVLEALLAWVVISALSWRWLLALSALPCFLLLPFFQITPESPRYLCAQNRLSDAMLVLERIANTNQAALPAGVLTYHPETKDDHISLTFENEHLRPVREMESKVGNAMGSKSGGLAVLRELLSRRFFRTTLLLWFVFFANAFAYYGLVLLTSQLSDVNRSCKSGLIIELHQKDANLYKDTFITSLAGSADMETYTVDDALAGMGFGKFQVLVLVYAGMGWVAEVMQIMLLSFVGPLVQEEWKISAQDVSLLSSVVFAGMLIGACTWGFVSDKYGRRSVLLFSTLLTTGMGFLSALSPNYLCLLALRFLVGLGVSASHVFSSWFSEFIPAQNRGTWMVVFNLFWTFGTILEASLAWVVASALSWRWLLAFTTLPCFFLLLFFRITPESPRYLCAHNRMSDAVLILERMATANQCALPPGVLTYHRETKDFHDTLTSEIEQLLPIRENEFTVDNAMTSKSGGIDALRTLLSRKLLRTTLLLWFVSFANSFAYYGLVLLASQLNDANRSCKSGLIYEVLEKDGNLYKDTFIASLAEIPGLIIAAVLVDWFGRKATMWCTRFACCAFLGPLIVYQNELLTTALLFGARACGMVSSTVLNVYDKEVYPTNVRSTGVGIGTAISRIGAMICPLVAVGMLQSCHQMEAILVFEMVLCLAAVACILFPVETRGRDME